MNNRDRLLAIMQGKELDRVPFIQYDNMAPNKEVWSLLGRNNVGLVRWSGIHGISTPNCAFETAPIVHNGLKGERRTLHTPAGDLVEEYTWEPALGTVSRHERFVKEPKDYECLRAYLKDILVVNREEHFLRDREQLGEDGLPHVNFGRTPFQQMWVEWANLDDFCGHLVDCPDIVEECMNLMADHIREMVEIARTTEVPYVVFGDNITAPIIGEAYFRRWCVPVYKEAAEMLSERGAPVFVHMDGDLKPLWAAIGESGVGGIDSFSPPPDNDTTPAEAIAMWPNMRLYVNFPSSVHLAPPAQIRQRAEEILAEAGHSHRLVMAISENMPPDAWKTSYPEIAAAIEEFGAP